MLKRTLQLTGSIVICLLAGIIGSLATTPNIPTWYEGLEKPILNPPNWVFGPTWTILYILMGLSLFLFVIALSEQRKKNGYLFFATQLILNCLWSVVFFGLHWLWLSIAIILTLEVTIILTFIEVGKFSKASRWLLAPYILWVAFASYLNIAIAFLN